MVQLSTVIITCVMSTCEHELEEPIPLASVPLGAKSTEFAAQHIPRDRMSQAMVPVHNLWILQIVLASFSPYPTMV